MVPEKQPFMATSCCPAWSVMAKKEFPGFAPYISMTMTPMVLTARLQKRRRPGCRVVFIGPCAAKKLEASRRSVRSDVDFVITFEELRGMFEAKGIDFSQIPDLPSHYEASAPGVGFAAGGGVAKAVEEVIHRLHPEVEVKTAAAEGLNECRKMLRIARTASMTAICWRAWPAPVGALPAPVPCSRRKSPAVHWRSIRRRYLSVTRWTPSIWRGPVCCTKTRRTGTAWVGIDEFGV